MLSSENRFVKKSAWLVPSTNFLGVGSPSKFVHKLFLKCSTMQSGNFDGLHDTIKFYFADNCNNSLLVCDSKILLQNVKFRI